MWCCEVYIVYSDEFLSFGIKYVFLSKKKSDIKDYDIMMYFCQVVYY